MRRKKVTATLLTAVMAGVMAASMAGCGSGIEAGSSAATESTIKDKYVVEGMDFTAEPGKTYKRIKPEEFVEDFNKLLTLNPSEPSYYEDIVEIFGSNPGVHFVDFDDETFAYYKWYSKDGNEVWITFRKVEDGKLQYYSWSSGTMDMEELEETSADTSAETDTSAAPEAEGDASSDAEE